MELKDGRILDPSLRDNLSTYGANVDDIAVGQEIFSREQWTRLTSRFPW